MLDFIMWKCNRYWLHYLLYVMLYVLCVVCCVLVCCVMRVICVTCYLCFLCCLWCVCVCSVCCEIHSHQYFLFICEHARGFCWDRPTFCKFVLLNLLLVLTSLRNNFLGSYWIFALFFLLFSYYLHFAHNCKMAHPVFLSS